MTAASASTPAPAPAPEPICSRCEFPEWTHEHWVCIPARALHHIEPDDMRREIVLRELNHGALAGIDSRITHRAADALLAALNRYDEWVARRR